MQCRGESVGHAEMQRQKNREKQQTARSNTRRQRQIAFARSRGSAFTAGTSTSTFLEIAFVSGRVGERGGPDATVEDKEKRKNVKTGSVSILI